MEDPFRLALDPTKAHISTQVNLLRPSSRDLPAEIQNLQRNIEDSARCLNIENAIVMDAKYSSYIDFQRIILGSKSLESPFSK